MNNEEQLFLNNLDKQLWAAADRLRAAVNPSEYMHVVLGLVFLKYIFDAFKERRLELEAAFKDPANDYYLGDDTGELMAQELEARDYYTETNVFWVPALARWDFLKDNAKVAIDTVLTVKNGKSFEYKFKGIGRLLDDALEALEKDNPDLRADFIMANPPFNMKAWKEGVKDDDPRWKYGVPPDGNANFAWMQHMIHHLAPHGSMALLLANGSMSSNTNNEGEIRKAIIEADLVVCMVALPGQIFTNTQIPACIWFLTRSKAERKANRNRRGEVLFIDARQLGYMKDRVLRDFKLADLAKVANTFHAWQRGAGYADEAGFCKAATLVDIRKADYVLTPGRYVGAAAQEADAELFEEKMARLTGALSQQFKDSARLESAIRKNLAGLGYEV